MPVVDNAIYADRARWSTPESLERTFDELRRCTDPARFRWIGLLEPDLGEVAAVVAEFGLHALVVEDTIAAHGAGFRLWQTAP